MHAAMHAALLHLHAPRVGVHDLLASCAAHIATTPRHLLDDAGVWRRCDLWTTALGVHALRLMRSWRPRRKRAPALRLMCTWHALDDISLLTAWIRARALAMRCRR
jgi:hypothetical protein